TWCRGRARAQRRGRIGSRARTARAMHRGGRAIGTNAWPTHSKKALTDVITLPNFKPKTCDIIASPEKNLIMADKGGQSQSTMRSATLAFDFELPSSKLGAPLMTARASPASWPDLGALRPDPAVLPGRAGRPDWIAQATCIAAAVVLH